MIKTYFKCFYHLNDGKALSYNIKFFQSKLTIVVESLYDRIYE